MKMVHSFTMVTTKNYKNVFVIFCVFVYMCIYLVQLGLEMVYIYSYFLKKILKSFISRGVLIRE